MDPLHELYTLADTLSNQCVSKRIALRAYKLFCSEQLTPDELSQDTLMHTYRTEFLTRFMLLSM